MSMANVLFRPDAVSIYTDTMVYGAGEGKPVRLSEEPKARINAAAGLIWSTRGVVGVGMEISALLSAPMSYSGALGVIAHRLRSIPEAIHEKHGSEVILAGWCEDAGAMRVTVTECRCGHFEVKEMQPGAFLHPNVTDKVAIPPTATDATMRKIALAQWKISHMRDLRMCLGGSLWRTTVTRDGVSQEIVDLFPDYDEHRAAFGDEMGEAVDLFRERQEGRQRIGVAA